MRAVYRKESTVEQGKIRRPVNHQLRYQKNLTHGARHGPPMRQCMYYKAHDMLWKARKHKSGGKDGTRMTNTASLCQMLSGLRNRSFNMMQSHWEIIPTWLHGKKEVGTENPGNCL